MQERVLGKSLVEPAPLPTTQPLHESLQSLPSGHSIQSSFLPEHKVHHDLPTLTFSASALFRKDSMGACGENDLRFSNLDYQTAEHSTAFANAILLHVPHLMLAPLKLRSWAISFSRLGSMLICTPTVSFAHQLQCWSDGITIVHSASDQTMHCTSLIFQHPTEHIEQGERAQQMLAEGITE